MHQIYKSEEEYSHFEAGSIPAFFSSTNYNLASTNIYIKYAEICVSSLQKPPGVVSLKLPKAGLYDRVH